MPELWHAYRDMDSGAMSVSIARQLGIKMCEAYGLNPAEVVSVDVHWRPDRLPTATVELLINERIVQQLLTLHPVESCR